MIAAGFSSPAFRTHYMGSKARVMVNVLVNARGHANVLIGHEDALIHGNANIMEDTANIGTITGITIVNAPDQGNVIIDVKRSIMMIGTSIGNLIPDENVHPEKIAIVVNIVSKKNENDLDIKNLSLIKLFCFCTTCKTLISVHILFLGLINQKRLQRICCLTNCILFHISRQGYKGLLQFLDLETWRQRLLQLLGLFLILDYQSVKESGASNLELGAVGVLLDFDALGIFPAGLHEEVLKKRKKLR